MLVAHLLTRFQYPAAYALVITFVSDGLSRCSADLYADPYRAFLCATTDWEKDYVNSPRFWRFQIVCAKFPRNTLHFKRLDKV
jgi:hypothetical protein